MTIDQILDYAPGSKINIDMFVTLMKKNTAYFTPRIMERLDIFKGVWNDVKKECWPEKRKYSEWRFEFYTWLRSADDL